MSKDLRLLLGGKLDSQSALNTNISNLRISMKLIKQLKDLDLNHDTLDYINKNQKILQNNLKIARKNKNSLSETYSYGPSPYRHSASSNDGACYIATMAYGDYNSPQVIKLRAFRDSFLKKHLLGKLFISVYYRVSPILVTRLKNYEKINSIIRRFLNQFIKFIF